jgi:hypothetical protein
MKTLVCNGRVVHLLDHHWGNDDSSPPVHELKIFLRQTLEIWNCRATSPLPQHLLCLAQDACSMAALDSFKKKKVTEEHYEITRALFEQGVTQN